MENCHRATEPQRQGEEDKDKEGQGDKETGKRGMQREEDLNSPYPILSFYLCVSVSLWLSHRGRI
jgi:hypothetical protein